MAKKLAVIFGIVFVIVGILGFIGTPIVGEEGYFVTDTIHDIVHLLVGVILLVVSTKGEGTSALWLKIFGAVYLLLFVNGLIMPDKLLGFVTANGADTWLHLILGIVLLVAGFTGGRNSVMMDRTTM
jgi:hypothetical protein